MDDDYFAGFIESVANAARRAEQEDRPYLVFKMTQVGNEEVRDQAYWAAEAWEDADDELTGLVIQPDGRVSFSYEWEPDTSRSQEWEPRA